MKDLISINFSLFFVYNHWWNHAFRSLSDTKEPVEILELSPTRQRLKLGPDLPLERHSALCDLSHGVFLMSDMRPHESIFKIEIHVSHWPNKDAMQDP